MRAALLAAACACSSQGCTTPTFSGLGAPDADLPAGPTNPDPGDPADGPDGGLASGGLGSGAARDASIELPSLGLVDGGAVSVDANVPAWAAELVGYYARRTISYGFDAKQQLFRTMTLLSLARVVADEQGALTITTEPCRLELTWPGAAGGPVDTGTPSEGAVSMRQYLYFDDDGARTFQLSAGALRFGFDVDRVGTCSAGTLRPPYPDQRWLLLPPVCRCTATPQALPSSYDDCRLADSDDDGSPGFTLRERRSSGAGARYATAIEVACSSGLGSLARDGRLMLDETVLAAAQCVNAAVDGCIGTPVPSCEVSRTELAALDGRAPGCADVLGAGLDKFTTPAGAPSACGAP